MAKRQLGIRTIYLCDYNSLLTTPVNPLVMGYRGNCEMSIEDHQEIKTVLNQTLSNMMNFKVETPSFQATLSMLKTLLGFVSSNCDAQLITVPQTVGSASSGGIFNFTGNNYPGLEFEMTITPKERICKITLEFATHRDEGLTIITQALTNVPKDLSSLGTGKYGVSNVKRIPPVFVSALMNGTAICPRDEIKDYKLVIKSKDSGKMAYNRANVSYVSALFEITGADATVNNIYNKYLIAKESSLVLTQKYDSSNDDVFTFNAGVLGRKEKSIIGDDKGELTLTFEADIPLPDISITGTDPHAITFG